MLLDELKLGRSFLDMDYGIVSYIQDNTYHIIEFSGVDEPFKKGDSFPLNMVYCSVVYYSRELFGVHNIQNPEGRKLHPLYENIKLNAYIGLPIYKDNQVYGTLNFSSKEVREEPFSSSQISFLKDTALLIENKLP